MSEATKQRKEETSQNREYSLDKAFLSSEVVPNAADAFCATTRNIDEAIKDAVFVLDTNVLLLPFGAGASSLKQITEVYRKLNSENRLLIPAQVAREFIKNRPDKITDLYQGLSDKISRFSAPDRLSYPILEGIEEFKVLNEVVEKAATLKSEISKANAALLKRIRNWEWNDPVSQAYKAEFTSKNIVEPECDKQKILDELRRRYDLKIPPGYKDAGKDDYGIGDYLIWKTILDVGQREKKDVIFISGDEKADWQHRAAGGGFLPRYELLDEYRRASDGKSLFIIPLSKLLELMKAEAGSVQEIKQEEARVVDASTVTVACPHCQSVVEWRLRESIGSSAKPVCPSCEQLFHLHRTRTGVTVRTPGERISQQTAPVEMPIGVDESVERVSCPECGSDAEVRLGVRPNWTAWAVCASCNSRFPVHRRFDGSVLVSQA